MERDARIQRGERPFVFTNLKDGTGLDTIVDWLKQHLASQQRRPLIDAHAPYVGHSHEHEH
jgi:urease accessory protein